MKRSPGSTIRLRLYVALVLAFGTVLLLVPTATGIALHEWVGLLLIVPIVVHLVVDWDWIVSVSRRFWRRQSGRTRFNCVMDWLVFLLTIVVWVSGVLVSEAALPSIGVQVSIDTFWTTIHIFTTRLFMVAIGVHVAMHAKWILR